MSSSVRQELNISPQKQKAAVGIYADFDKHQRQRDKFAQQLLEILRNGEKFKHSNDEKVIAVHKMAKDNKDFGLKYVQTLLANVSPHDLEHAFKSHQLPELIGEYETYTARFSVSASRRHDSGLRGGY